MTAIDQAAKPYDITPIPFFPWAPGMIAWGLLLLTIALALGLVWLAARRRQRSHLGSLDEALAELRACAAAEITESSALARVTLLGRRVLSTILGEDVTVLTSSELSAAAGRSTERSRQEVFTILSELEARRFSPSPRISPAEVRTLVAALEACRTPSDGAEQPR